MSINLPQGISISKGNDGENEGNAAYFINSESLGYVGAIVIRNTGEGTQLDTHESDIAEGDPDRVAKLGILQQVSKEFMQALN